MASTVAPSKTVAAVAFYDVDVLVGVLWCIYVLFCFSGLRFVAFCGSVSARERSVGRGNAALGRACGAVSKIYGHFRSMSYMSVSLGVLQG